MINPLAIYFFIVAIVLGILYIPVHFWTKHLIARCNSIIETCQEIREECDKLQEELEKDLKEFLEPRIVSEP